MNLNESIARRVVGVSGHDSTSSSDAVCGTRRVVGVSGHDSTSGDAMCGTRRERPAAIKPEHRAIHELLLVPALNMC